MTDHYFVTGAAGFIGRHLCRLLRAQGREVTALVRGAPPADLERAGVRVVRAALDQTELYEPALARCSHVVHLAGEARFGNGPGYQAANVEATATLLAAVARSCPGLARFVFVSTIGAVDRAPADPCRLPLDDSAPPDPSSDYGRSKLAAERLVAASGLPFVIVRPAMVVGPDMRAGSHVAVFARAALTGGVLARFALSGAFSVVDVDDLAAALVIAADHPDAAGRTLFAAGDPLRLADIFERAASGRFRVPVGWLASAVRPLARFLPFAVKALLYPALTADDGALRRLGWRPARPGLAAIDPVIEREAQRADPLKPPPGRTVVTGAASGLGRAMAEALAQRGRRLLLIDRDGAGLARVLADQPGVERAVCDLADTGQLAALLASEVWRRGAADAPVVELFACAGFGLRGAVAALPADRQADILRVNVIARLLMSHQVIPDMRAGQFGRIVLISSSSAFQPLPFMAVYAASNAALLLLGEALAAEVAGDGIEVLTVCPGGMATGFQKRAGVQELSGETLAAPQAVAEQILASLGRNRMTLLPAARSQAMALLARLLPRRMAVALWYRLMVKLR